MILGSAAWCDQIATPGEKSTAVLGRSHACAQCRLNDARRSLVGAWSLQRPSRTFKAVSALKAWEN
jgi:hypothetical protein